MVTPALLAGKLACCLFKIIIVFSREAKFLARMSLFWQERLKNVYLWKVSGNSVMGCPVPSFKLEWVYGCMDPWLDG